MHLGCSDCGLSGGVEVGPVAGRGLWPLWSGVFPVGGLG